MEFFGVRLIGMNAESGRKLLLTLTLVLLLWLLSRIVRAILRRVFRHRDDVAASFWSRQAVQIALTMVGLLVFASIWFDQPGRIGSIAGLVTAGLAIALGKVVTALAGYFVILRSRVFNIGDRIAMGGVRGDVIGLSFLRTTIMEMGQAPEEEKNVPDVWVGARQYTGRIVTVTNDKVFSEPVYNFSRDFHHFFEEMKVGIPYTADRRRAEEIMLKAAREHTQAISELVEREAEQLYRRYFIARGQLEPRVYIRFTDNWLELALRFVVPTHGVREIKDAIARDILNEFEHSGIPMAAPTLQIVGWPSRPWDNS